MNTSLHGRSKGSAVRRALPVIAAGFFAAACSAQKPAPPPAATQPPPVAATEIASSQSTSPPARPQFAKSPSFTIKGYKQDVAASIYRANEKSLYPGAPPPLLKSVVVLSIIVDNNGQPRRVEVIRSNGYHDLEQVAVRSVHRAAPLPKPGFLVARAGSVEFTETWLFRDDGRFQIRSLAQAQATSEE